MVRRRGGWSSSGPEPCPAEPTPAPGAFADLVGLPAARLRERLGTPSAERRVAGDVWRVYDWADLSLRVRCRHEMTPADHPPADAARLPGEGDTAASEERVVSWTASFGPDLLPKSLSEAATRLGLWPACAPDEKPSGSGATFLLRRVLEREGMSPHSLTATIRRGRVAQLTVFDESPEWL